MEKESAEKQDVIVAKAQKEVVLVVKAFCGDISFYSDCIERIETPSKMINDNGVDYGLSRIYSSLPADIQKKIHIFSVLFFEKLTEVSPGYMTYKVTETYDEVRRWTKKVDIMSKEYIIVPWYRNDHFSLAIIVRPGLVQPSDMKAIKTEDSADMPVFLHMDPLSGYHNSDEIATVLREYLKYVYYMLLLICYFPDT